MIRREYRVVEEDDSFTLNGNLFGLWDMEKILLYPEHELEDFVHIRETLKQRMRLGILLSKKKSQPKFRQYDIINEGED